eukprot:TRINITY_DN12653_c0_g9_i1.p1 TRINITY_DN12653_c0_g9~~TRINITY_DN12653_c0_g9_i1.p1  ORF type:complete len:547 (+),score=71.90 TRINITY_DN12653_c0_g9_i1:81-1721(+)
MGARSRCLLATLLFVGLIEEGVAIDGQSNKPSDAEAERVFNDPNCERTRGTEVGIDWDLVRMELHSTPYPQSVNGIFPVIGRLERNSDFDREVQVCPFGIIAVLFFFVKFLIEEAGSSKFGMARVHFSLLDIVASGMHPHLLDRADWLVKDSRLSALRRAVLSRHQSRVDPERRYPRVFVYDKETPEVRQLTQGAAFCGKGQWGMEVHFHEWLLASPYLVQNPADADFFFVPAYSICMFEGGFYKFPELDEVYKKLVKGLPHFAQNKGRDHIFTFGSGMSANVFKSWRETISESIFLTPETWLFNDFAHITEPCFNTWKDIAIPGYLHRHEILSLTSQARPLAEREHLAVFLGRTDPSRGPHPTTGGTDVRGAIARLHAQGRVFVAQNLSIPDMHAVMGNARFCFVPKGKSAWSLRFFEALFANCVPVVLSDHWELPFESFLDLPSSTIKWPMDDVGDRLMELLQMQPDHVVEEYMAKARSLRCWYIFPPLLHEVDADPNGEELKRLCPNIKSENAFEGIMRLLERKRRSSWTMGRFFDPSQIAGR